MERQVKQNKLDYAKHFVEMMPRLEGKERQILNVINMLSEAYSRGKITDYKIYAVKEESVELVARANVHGLSISIGCKTPNRFSDATRALLRALDEMKRLISKVDMLNLSLSMYKNVVPKDYDTIEKGKYVALTKDDLENNNVYCSTDVLL